MKTDGTKKKTKKIKPQMKTDEERKTIGKRE